MVNKDKRSSTKQEPSHRFLLLYFFINGMMSLTPFFVFLSEADYYQAQYSDFLFYFWSIMPGNIAVPISVIVQKKMSFFSLSNGNLISTLLCSTFITATLIPA